MMIMDGKDIYHVSLLMLGFMAYISDFVFCFTKLIIICMCIYSRLT